MSGLERLAQVTLDEAFLLHRDWGPGLLESFYRLLLARRLARRGLSVAQAVSISLDYQGEVHQNLFRADIVVENRLLIELKSVEALQSVHSKQLLTYLRVMNLPLGLLINFGGAMLRDGIRRVINPSANLSEVLDRKSGLLAVPKP